VTALDRLDPWMRAQVQFCISPHDTPIPIFPCKEADQNEILGTLALTGYFLTLGCRALDRLEVTIVIELEAASMERVHH